MGSGLNTGLQRGLKLCRDCGRVCQVSDTVCPRCGARVQPRIEGSITRCWALTITAALLYIPANVLPMMTVDRFGTGQPDTIMSGVMELVNHGMIPIAILVFTASVLVPLLKLVGMFWLLLSVGKPGLKVGRQMQLYRLIIWVGRWSMLDIFIIAILVAIVQFGQLGSVTAGPGVYAFSAVVVITMLAAAGFDPRLLWDSGEQGAGKTESMAQL
ncbi:paraquat-inducible protein A [Endozoicomonas sp. Mp262]|uniref:paraquat-inducible protein A n=1 Tax=Endozoicomonas sp. Mp262 TaxID=2919499 RepID=UPI0021D877D1